MQDFMNKKILLGVCGGVAAYKAAYLIRELKGLGADVQVVMTHSAQEFLRPLLLQALSGKEVRTQLFDLHAEKAMGHIELARWADYLIISPASANCLAKMAHGVANDLLSTLYLVTETPTIVCPAMNKSMWAHPATQANCQLLKERGVIFVGPQKGLQACGEYGLGRGSEAEQILIALRLLALNQRLAGKRLVITAGPTREFIDPVRYLSNCSSGKMGYALAEAAAWAGAQVILISGPTNLETQANIEVIQVESAQDMLNAVMNNLHEGSLFIGAAAVSDYRVDLISKDKIKKKDQEKLNLHLVKNVDILQAVVASRKAGYVVGFAAETKNLLDYAQDKLHQKQLDMIVANQVGKNFDSDFNQVLVLTQDKQIELPLTHKMILAGEIIAILATNLQNARLSQKAPS
jgi:phosphopantothenoylcysteine decarboxylase/phosphopantothenate--cysteine ligase